MFKWTHIYSVLINTSETIRDEELAELFGYTEFTRVSDADKIYDNVIHPEFYMAYIGNYKNSIIISAERLPDYLFDEEEAPNLEKKLGELFPQSEICAIKYIHNAELDVWGFSIIQNGKLIRKRFENRDLNAKIDFGEPLAEEKNVLGELRINDIGERSYYVARYSSFFYDWECEVGAQLINQIYKRYTGSTLELSAELLNTKFRAYVI